MTYTSGQIGSYVIIMFMFRNYIFDRILARNVTLINYHIEQECDNLSHICLVSLYKWNYNNMLHLDVHSNMSIALESKEWFYYTCDYK